MIHEAISITWEVNLRHSERVELRRENCSKYFKAEFLEVIAIIDIVLLIKFIFLLRENFCNYFKAEFLQVIAIVDTGYYSNLY